jgi:hypothetical protein
MILSLQLSVSDWLALFNHFLSLSLLAVGGAIITAPDMHRFLVDENQWLTEQQFSSSIALAQSGSNIFVNLADFGLVTQAVTATDDLGSVTETATILTDLEFIVTSGVFYPTQLVLPPYTVMTLPNASPSGQMIYVTDDSGGAVPAFSDGTDWRRVTDRAVVS